MAIIQIFESCVRDKTKKKNKIMSETSNYYFISLKKNSGRYFYNEPVNNGLIFLCVCRFGIVLLGTCVCVCAFASITRFVHT